MHYFSHHMGDHARVARHFSIAEDGAYLRLATAYFSRMQPLPLEEAAIYRLVVAATDDEKRAVDAVLQDLFRKTPDGWCNDSFDKQISTYRANSNQAREAANTRWTKRRQGADMQMDSDSNAVAMRPHNNGNTNQEPVTTNQKPITNNQEPTTLPAQPEAERSAAQKSGVVRRRVEYPADFMSFWEKYPRKVGKDAALTAWKVAMSRTCSEELDAAAVRFGALCKAKRTPADKIPYPTTWLNAGRWQDEELGKVKLASDGTVEPIPWNERPGIKYSFPKSRPGFGPLD